MNLSPILSPGAASFTEPASTLANRLVVAMLCLFFATSSFADIEVLNSPLHESAGLPFSEAVRYNGVIYVSGQIGAVPGTTDVVEGGIEAQTTQVMQNIGAILERNGSSLQRIVKCTIFLADMAEWPAMNKAYLRALGAHRPARSALGVNGLALGSRVEIECIDAAGA